MSIIPRAPRDLNDCRVIRDLEAKSNALDGLAERAQAFISAATPLVDLIVSGPFKEWTLHNRDHAKKLIHLFEYLIPNSTFTALSPLELLTLVYAAFLHDMALCVTSVERERIISSDEFVDALREWSELWDALSRARTSLQQVNQRLAFVADPSDVKEQLRIEADIFQLQEAGLVTYLRPIHATALKYKTFTELLKKQTGRQDLFEINGASFEDYLINICVSHNLDAGALAEVAGPYDERYPRDATIGGERLNTQFCASVLRLADILDFDRERTPPVLFESLAIPSRTLPGADVTLQEWQKHLAVHTVEIANEEIIVTADCKHPAIEKTIRDFCQIIEREIRDTLAVVRRNRPEIVSQYNFELPVSVRPRIRSQGYIYKDMSLRLNQTAVMSLLMGERLYAQKSVAIRELIQNAVDACGARLMIDGATYAPRITLSTIIDEHDRHWIVIADNGTGMDEHILAEYFLTLGNSYYDSPEFSRLARMASRASDAFVPISRFGVGLVSVFMIADTLEVRTKSAHSPRGDRRPLYVRIERSGGIAFMTELPGTTFGTEIRVRATTELEQQWAIFAIQCRKYLKEVVVRPKVSIDANVDGEQFILAGQRSLSLRSGAAKVLDGLNIEAVQIEMARWSDHLSGVVVIFLGKQSDGTLSHRIGGRSISIDFSSTPFQDVLANHSGNRITVNGFKMGQRKLSNVLGRQKNRIPVVYDIDAVGSKDIIYDVSRDRIIGDGALLVRREFKAAIVKGLRETGVVDRLDPSSLALIEAPEDLAGQAYDSAKPTAMTTEIIERVKAAMPSGRWPTGIHKSIAADLGITPRQCSQAISTLLEIGAITNPNTSPA